MKSAKKVTIHEAKTHLSRYLKLVEKGEEIIIANGSRPVARLSPLTPALEKRRLGRDAHAIWIAEDFDAPLPTDFLKLFEGK